MQDAGEIGQTLGYLAAAGVGTGNFAILCAVAWMYSNKPKVRAWWERRRGTQRDALMRLLKDLGTQPPAGF